MYDIHGRNTIGYDLDGSILAQAYDIDGNVLISNFFVAMTYNVGRFTGINSQQAMQNSIVSKYKPDIIGMQELGNGQLGTVGVNMLTDYSYKQLSDHNNKIMLVAKQTPGNYSTCDFTNQDPLDMSLYSETRAYQRADITINGKVVTWFNAHLCFNTQEIKWQQMSELFVMAENCDYSIITGDFNATAMNEESTEYINMFKPFVDAGYHLAINSPSTGFYNTWSGSTSPSSIADLTWACDNIIVSSNIGIISVLDTTKFGYLNGSEFDHIPVVAYLSILN